MPDADIYPTATGKALDTVNQHQKEEDLIFYSGWFCRRCSATSYKTLTDKVQTAFVQRVWIALQERGIKYQYREENPYHKDQEFLEVSPKGLVPVRCSLLCLRNCADSSPGHQIQGQAAKRVSSDS